MQYEPVIGLEVHAQLRTRSKVFCGCSTRFGAPPNSQTCPVCLGLPGSLPVVNGPAVEMAVTAGLALGCRINRRSLLARKNYFYPDLPKGYQISQYEEPLAVDGRVRLLTLDFGAPGNRGTLREFSVEIIRVHLEEDAGKSIHAARQDTQVNLNRCGVPLMEIVTHPDLRSGREASDFLDYLRRVLLYLALCDGNMEEGSLRCDANISVRPLGETSLGTKTEIKNLNSFRFLNKALDYEIQRQIRVLESGRQVVQETRLWEEDLEETRPMRSKEEAHDYRYFPDPDLLPVVISAERLDELRKDLPELPGARAPVRVPVRSGSERRPRGHPDPRVCRLLRSIRKKCWKPQDGSELDGRGFDPSFEERWAGTPRISRQDCGSRRVGPALGRRSHQRQDGQGCLRSNV